MSVSDCHETSTRGGAAYVAGSWRRNDGAGTLRAPGSRFGSVSSATHPWRKSTPRMPATAPPSDGTRTAPASSASIKKGRLKERPPVRSRFACTRDPPSAPLTPMIRCSPLVADRPTVRAYPWSSPKTVDPVSSTNQPASPSSTLASTSTCPPSPRMTLGSAAVLGSSTETREAELGGCAHANAVASSSSNSSHRRRS